MVKWTPGPARCRSDEYEAEISFTDMGGDYPIGGRIRRKGIPVWLNERWTADGNLRKGTKSPMDLMPPTITREALARECSRLYQYAPTAQFQDWEAVVAHVIEAVKSGRVE